ncbi:MULTISPECIES: [NiFe]-hydrogenase assembly chaperone HybE [Nitrospirillum]|uniref:[NiFe] hydrogenase assembly HybE family chaperone n=1 Tax=Nitrospirillum amazonense TaxID=28077 RepID=A0A560GEB0_9PROT|nr:[NiFe]-hydrogenase assembly chaperone HybE [Nitrospirillum amazonense]MEC4590957.1 [NiFe]-hydrogenase assembly chaperone HybE [Nitrospirillum amazonense]TWB32131.1 [NiFe] hydrogenase assembly HybE family chaperone [Nitrospirillum amazonense]
MTDAPALSARIETAFARIAVTRMAGVPVMNPALSVAMRGVHRHGGHWVGVLVTPWFMNLLLLPVAEEGPRQVGAKTALALPSGRYEGIWGHEDDLGGYWSCSLFSPMFDFADQETAVATADAALAEIMAVPEPDADDDGMATIWAGNPAVPPPAKTEPAPPPSRRALFGLGQTGPSQTGPWQAGP